MFAHKTPDSITIIAIYVDDILDTGNDELLITQLKAYLARVFSIKDLGRLSFFLRLELAYSDNGIVVTQQKFSRKLIRDAAITHLKPHVTPLPFNHYMFAYCSPLLSYPTVYRSLVG